MASAAAGRADAEAAVKVAWDARQAAIEARNQARIAATEARDRQRARVLADGEGGYLRERIQRRIGPDHRQGERMMAMLGE